MAAELRYADRIHLENGYNDVKGGFLDTNGHSPAGKYGVATAATSARGAGTGTWQIESATDAAYEVCTNAYFNRAADVTHWRIHQA